PKNNPSITHGSNFKVPSISLLFVVIIVVITVIITLTFESLIFYKTIIPKLLGSTTTATVNHRLFLGTDPHAGNSATADICNILCIVDDTLAATVPSEGDPGTHSRAYAALITTLA